MPFAIDIMCNAPEDVRRGYDYSKETKEKLNKIRKLYCDYTFRPGLHCYKCPFGVAVILELENEDE